MHAWVFNEGCDLIGSRDGFGYGGNLKPAYSLYSQLRYVVMFRVYSDTPPMMAYADQYHGRYGRGWSLYYPNRRHMDNWYWFRHFDCHRP